MARAAPYLVLGFGQILFDDDFRNDADLPLSDQATVILGAGLRLPLGERFRLNGAIRNYVTASSTYDEVATASDLRHNPAIEVGLSYLLLGRNGERPAVPVVVVAPQPTPRAEPPPAAFETRSRRRESVPGD